MNLTLARFAHFRTLSALPTEPTSQSLKEDRYSPGNGAQKVHTFQAEKSTQKFQAEWRGEGCPNTSVHYPKST